jgi:ADP-ribose pyrophosphatase YjhB (NUDIX family)
MAGITTPKVGVNAVFFNEKGEVLLTQRSDNQQWCIPGGHVDLGETLSEAAVREAKEETGLDVNAVRVTGVYSKPENSIYIHLGPENQIVAVVFLCEVTGGELTLSDETIDYAWFPVDKMPPLISNHTERVQHALLDGPPYFE